MVPKLGYSVSHKTQTIGSIFHITCSLEEGSLPVFFEWSRNGQTLKSSPDVNYKIENFEMHSTFTIKSIERRDAGNYSCLVNNGFGSDGQSLYEFFFSVEYESTQWTTIPKLGYSVSHKTQTIGSIFHITCSLEEGFLPVFFEWSRNGQSLRTGPEVNYKIDNFETHSSFNIKNAGNYTCLVKNALGDDRHTVLLSIKAPKLAKHVSHKTQPIGTYFQIFCNLESGSLPVFYEWLRNGQTLRSGPDVNYKIENFKKFSTFSIDDIGRSDSANYTCLASNGFGSDNISVVLSINVPKLGPAISHKSQIIGTVFHIMCSIESGSLPVFFEWSRNGQSLRTGPDFNYKIENFKKFSTFSIDEITRSDSGNYTCLVRNALGDDRHTVLLSIKGPKLSKHVSHKSQSIGTYFQVFCNVESGSLPMFYEWSRNGQSLKTSPEVNYKIENNDMFSRIIIKKIETKDAANYTCLVSNAFGSDRQTVLLSINVYIPKINSIENHNYSYMPKLGSIVSHKSLSIGKAGSSPVFFEWSRNGQTIKSSPEVNYKIESSKKFSTLTIDEITRSDSANYTCLVKNSLGTDSQSMLLSIKAPKLAISGIINKTQPIGSNFQIFCSVETGSHPLFFEWLRNGHQIKSISKEVIPRTIHVLQGITSEPIDYLFYYQLK
ncbi:unnamed protein product, partial [Medioppia subpectinata]